MGGHGTSPGDAHVAGKLSVCPEHPAAQTAARVSIEMGDLPSGVHTGVGAPGADEADGLRGDGAEGSLRQLLHG